MPAEAGNPVRSLWGALLVWLLGTGIIGEEISGGTILLVLSRPVRRWEYVVSKWTALSALTAVIVLVQALAIAAIQVRNQGAVDPWTFGFTVLSSLMLGMGSAAVLIFFSVMIPAGREISAVGVVYLVGSLCKILGPVFQHPWLGHAGEELVSLLYPTVTFVRGGGIPWVAVTQWASSTYIALLAAVVALNRKELSYAAG
jgi:ABC-type Na+ efflux pump permease subunit